MDLYFDAELEIRAKAAGQGRTLAGRFPYNRTATIRDRGRVRKERFVSKAFAWSIEEFMKAQSALAQAITDQAARDVISELKDRVAKRNINLLSGHSFDQPLASLAAGTLILKDGDDALTFEADLPGEDKQPTWMRDAVLAIEGGLASGVSPGFRIPPPSVVSDAERLIDEPGNTGVQIREILQAVLYELSIVTRPAYAETEVEAREDNHANTPKRRRRVWL